MVKSNAQPNAQSQNPSDMTDTIAETLAGSIESDQATTPRKLTTELSASELAALISKYQGPSSETKSSEEQVPADHIFDPRLRDRLETARAKKPLAVATPEPYSYRDNSGDDIFVDGDTCYKISDSQHNPYASSWSLGYRCPWVKSQSEKMADGISQSLQSRAR